MRPALQAAYAGILGAALLPALLRKTLRSGLGALHIVERLAYASLPGGQPVWISAASVGETMAISGLLNSLREAYPRLPFALTYSSEAARAVARERLQLPVFAQPLDFASVERRFFAALRPRLCLLVEQELWPNMLLQATRENIPVVVVNGRLSARSARRHARLRKHTGALFAGLDLVLTQSRADAARFRLLGAPRTIVTGNLKFDTRPDADKVAAGLRLRAQIAAAHPQLPVLLLASTRPSRHGASEEILLLDALKPLLPRCVILLVPRHPERSAQVCALLNRRGVDHMLHSQLNPAALPRVIVGNTLGEMDSYIACADVVFIGASLVRSGGQNLMEPLAQGKPVVTGPYMHNFAELCARACNAGATWQGASATQVAALIEKLLFDEPLRVAAGLAGQRIASQSYGAQARTLEALAPIFSRLDKAA